MKMKMKMVLLSWMVVIAAMVVVDGHSPTGSNEGPREMKDWYRKLPHMKHKVTELHFYLHDIVSGSNPTNVPLVVTNSTSQSPTYFGLIAAIDDPLTEGPAPDSPIVGRAQGLFGSTSLDKIAYHMTFNFVFTSGKYNGSTLSVVGHNPFMDEYRELPIVGGSGVFRLARGTALLNTLTFNSTSGDAVVEYDVVVLHY
ncbi:dirigent protein 21-like [Sesamum indicum]|uniref:Dirigent protein n=1 Tax=Sesamum indicum TaxID=4182 RepID=A0A6I9U450_SESIN|nr:dirigent protein 21-like [Sesamum indicum]